MLKELLNSQSLILTEDSIEIITKNIQSVSQMLSIFNNIIWLLTTAELNKWTEDIGIGYK